MGDTDQCFPRVLVGEEARFSLAIFNCNSCAAEMMRGGESITFKHSVNAGLRNERSDRLLQGRGGGSLPSEENAYIFIQH